MSKNGRIILNKEQRAQINSLLWEYRVLVDNGIVVDDEMTREEKLEQIDNSIMRFKGGE